MNIYNKKIDTIKIETMLWIVTETGSASKNEIVTLTAAVDSAPVYDNQYKDIYEFIDKNEEYLKLPTASLIISINSFDQENDTVYNDLITYLSMFNIFRYDKRFRILKNRIIVVFAPYYPNKEIDILKPFITYIKEGSN